MKKFLLISAALIFSIFIGLQTPYVVRSSEVFCRTSPPQSEHCMLIKSTSPNDISLKPFYSSAGPAKFFTFDAQVEDAVISSNFTLYSYVAGENDENNISGKPKYQNSFEVYNNNCFSKPYEADLILITGEKNSKCSLYSKDAQLVYFSKVDKNARIICRYRRLGAFEGELQHNCTYDGYYSGWSWTIFIRSTQLIRWQHIVRAAQQHFDENFEHIDHPIIKIPLI